MSVRRLLRRVRNDLLGTVRRVETDEPLVALTFDDGPHPVHTPRLLDVLAHHDARATFFMLGEHARAAPDVVRRAAEDGHAIGNHTLDHPSFPLVGSRERRRQLRECAAILAPYATRLFRPPYGHESLASHLDALRSGYEVVAWDAHASDWEARDARSMLAQLREQVRPGSIVLLHDAIWPSLRHEVQDRSEVITAVAMLLEALSPRYRFVTVPVLLEHGRVVRGWYKPPDHAFLRSLPNGLLHAGAGQPGR
jgi:peptidoglycan-N-acetylglucosamine deacetylase